MPIIRRYYFTLQLVRRSIKFMERLKTSDRTFGIVFAVVFLIVALAPLLRKHSLKISFLILSFAFISTSLVWPKALLPLNKLWETLGKILEKITNPLIMGVLFYLVITPIGLILRLRKKDVLSLRLKSEETSYWLERKVKEIDPTSLRRQF